MRREQTRYVPSKKDSRQCIISNLSFEYSNYLSNLTTKQLREIAESDQFQLFNMKIENGTLKIENK